MSIEQALIKVLENEGTDLAAFVSAFPTQLLLRTFFVKGTVGGATGMTEYIGYALPGTTKAQPKWLIKKLIYDATGFQTDSLFANGQAKFNLVFDDGSSNYSNFTYSGS